MISYNCLATNTHHFSATVPTVRVEHKIMRPTVAKFHETKYISAILDTPLKYQYHLHEPVGLNSCELVGQHLMLGEKYYDDEGMKYSLNRNMRYR